MFEPDDDTKNLIRARPDGVTKDGREIEIILPPQPPARRNTAIAKAEEKALRPLTDEERFNNKMRTMKCFICGGAHWYPVSYQMCNLTGGNNRFDGVDCNLSFACQRCGAMYAVDFERGKLEL